MLSIRSRIINLLLKNRHLLQGKLRQERFTMDSSIKDFRKLCEEGASKYGKIPKNVKITSQCVEDINCEWIIPNDSPSDKVVLYVHGGGYVAGSCSDHRGFVSRFAERVGLKNFLYEYRLAPEFPFPAAIEDTVKVYKFLLNLGYQTENILIAGESAGGGLVLALLLYLRDHKIDLPAAAIAISPWTDLTCSSDSYRSKNKVSLAPLDSWLVFSKHYVSNNDPKNPYISPLFGDLSSLPPIYINSGENDELYDDGFLFAEKAKKDGNGITFRNGVGMVHCYPLLAPMFPEATQAMNEICDYMKKMLNL